MGNTAFAPTLTSLPVPAPEVVGLSEVAQLLGVDKDTAIRYSRRDGFPEPRRLASGPVWRTTEVVHWGEKYLPLARGPKKKGT